MTSKVVAIIAVILAFRGSYLANTAKDDEQKDYARMVSTCALILTGAALFFKLYE